MAFRLGNNAQEMASNQPASSATAFNLAGAETGRQTILAAIGDDNSATFIAQEVDANGNPAGAWQLFVGTLNDATPDTLSQDTIIASSNAGSAVDWSALSAPLITAVVDDLRMPRRVAGTTFAGAASFDFSTRADCVYLCVFAGIALSNDAVALGWQVRPSGGAVETGASDYQNHNAYQGGEGSPAGAGDASDTLISMFSSSTVDFFGNGGVGEEVSGQAWVYGARDAGTYTKIVGHVYCETSAGGGTTYQVRFGGHRAASQDDDLIRFTVSAGTISAGSITIYEFPL